MEIEEIQVIENGHVATPALREFADSPECFDDDTVETIWTHLDACENCLADYDRLKEGDDAPEPASESCAPKARPTEAREAVTFDPDDLVKATSSLPVNKNGKDKNSPQKPEQTTDRTGGDAASTRPTLAPDTTPDTDARKVSNPPPADESNAAPIEKSSDVPVADSEGPPPDSEGAPPKTGSETPPGIPSTTAKPAAPDPVVAPGPPTRSAKPHAGAHYKDLLKKSFVLLKKPKIAIAAVAVIALITLATVFLTPSGENPTVNPVEGWAPFDVIQTNVPLQEIPVRRLQDGGTESAAANDVDLDFRAIKELVIAIDLDFIRGASKPYDLVVRNLGGQIVFQETIPDLYINDGRLFLRLVPKQFDEEQRYTLELVEREAGAEAGAAPRVIAESVFRVVK